MDKAKGICRPRKLLLHRSLNSAEVIRMRLPSGREILLRRPDPAKLALVPADFIVRYAVPEDGPCLDKFPKKRLREIGRILGDILEHCCLEPGATRPPWVWQDLFYVARWATKELEQLRAAQKVKAEIAPKKQGDRDMVKVGLDQESS